MDKTDDVKRGKKERKVGREGNKRRKIMLKDELREGERDERKTLSKKEDRCSVNN